MKKPPFAGTNSSGSYSITNNMDPPSTTVNRVVSVETGSYLSVNTPGYRLIPKRDLPQNPFSHTVTKTVYVPGGMVSRASYGHVQVITGDMYDALGASDIVPLYTPDFSDVQKRATNKVLDRIQGSTVNLAQAFAERKQTVNLMAKTVNRLASAAIAIRRGNFKHATDLFGVKNASGKGLARDLGLASRQGGGRMRADVFSNHWLEYSYGWIPLLSDIYSSAEVIADTYFRVKPSKVSATHQLTENIGPYLVRSGITHNEMCVTTVKASARCQVKFKEDSSIRESLSKTGLTNPLLLAWELVPYSFVVDWFIPLGSYLKRLDAASGFSFVSGTQTLRTTTNHVTTCAGTKVFSGGEWIFSVSGVGRQVSYETKSRSVLTSFPSPSLVIPALSLGTSQILSGLALLTQAFKR